MITEETNIGGGLLELPDDERDFSFSAVFGWVELEEIPDEFVVAEPLYIKDQKATDYCTGYAVTAVSEDQEGIKLSPEFQFAMTKKISGNPDRWGANLRDACKSAVKSGSLPLERAPFNVDDPRYKVARHEDWSEHLKQEALKHKKESFFDAVKDGPYDRFDNLRSTLWMNRHDKRTIVTGVKWRKRWTVAVDGVVREVFDGAMFGHSFKFYGTKMLNGELYIRAQLSNGKEIGDGGIFYFSRAVINEEFKYGNFTFKDIEPEEAKHLIENGIKVTDNWLLAFAKQALSALKKLSSWTGTH